MNKNFLDLSEKIDSITLGALSLVAEVAESVNVRFFVAGATARDIVLNLGYDINTGRATLDLDLGVQVPDWDHYEKLTEGLVATGRFNATKEIHRLMYDRQLPLDFLPFGAIAESGEHLTWPPEHDVSMSVLGFEESYRHSLVVRLSSNPSLDIQIASVTGLALMKIISWNDRRVTSTKDATDLALIIHNYALAGNEERLLGEDVELFQKEGFDYEMAGARLLGRDIAAIANAESKKAVLEILDRETGEQARYRLVEHMTTRSLDFDYDYDKNLQLLEKLKSGVLDMP
ncbi:MAG: nucleotidyl transferase AbiEii/AbiGii toxin family protein [Deltaproteobacteria bacterium]|nr:nucleotidyl transferase AbiEii/AbiGii toxin family protein [Deltaproteobacteria bacterium]